MSRISSQLVYRLWNFRVQFAVWLGIWGLAFGVAGRSAHALPSVQWSSESLSVSEDTGDVEIPLTASVTTSQNYGVPYTLTGTASNGDDYDIVGTSVSFISDVSRAVVKITIADDAVAEDDETIILTLVDPGTGVNYTIGTVSVFTLTIVDNDGSSSTGGTAVANAGVDKSIVAGQSVTLNGSRSSGTDLSYSWTCDGSGTVSNADTSTPSYASASAETGDVTCTLTATDSSGSSDTDSVVLTVIGSSPTRTAVTSIAAGSFGETSVAEAHSSGSAATLQIGDTEVDISGDQDGSSFTYLLTPEGYLAIALPTANAGAGIVYVTTKPIDTWVEEASASLTLGNTVLGTSKALTVQASNRGLITLSGSTSSLFASVTGAAAGDALGTALASGDVDGDGVSELASSAPGAGSFGESYVYELPTDSRPTLQLRSTIVGSADFPILGSVAVGDFLNEDSIDDILYGLANAASNADVDFVDALSQSEMADTVFAVAGDTELASTIDFASQSPDFSIAASSTNLFQDVAVGDANADGKADIAVIDNASRVFVFFGPFTSGDSLSSSAADSTVTLEDSGQAVEITDLSCDGTGDIVIGSPSASDGSGSITALFGSESWEAAVSVADDASALTVTGESGEALGSDLEATDVDGDGCNELYSSIQGDTGTEVVQITTTEGSDTTTSDDPSGGSSSGGGGCSLIMDL